MPGGYPWRTGDALLANDLNAAIGNATAISGPPGSTAGWPFLPLSGGPLTGAPTTIQCNVPFTPSTGGAIGLAVYSTMSGTMGNVGGVAPFEIIINDSADSTNNPNWGLFAQCTQYNFGGTKGDHGCMNLRMQQTADVLDAGTTFFVSPLFTQLFVNYSGGGAGNAIATAFNLTVGGPNWGLAETIENGLNLVAGASVQQAYIESYIWSATQHATVTDAATCYVATVGSTVGMRSLWQIGRSDGQWPVDPAGWLMTTVQQANQNPGNTQRGAQAAAGGFDLSKVNFSSAALLTSGISLGNAVVAIGTGRLSENASGLVIDAPGQVGAVASIASGGSGYAVNDQVYDGHGGIILVTTVSAGAITAASYIAGREPYVFSAPPANPLATTGGSGSGATVNVTWTARAGLSVNPTGQHVGFNGTSPIAKPTVTGAKGSNAALASLLAALSSYGLISDTTTA